MRALAGAACLYLGGLILLSGWVVGNCTQDSTDELLAASLLGLMATIAAVVLFLSKPPPVIALLFAAPAFLLHLITVSREARAAYAFVVQARSFCAQMHDLPYGASGDEPLLIGLWIAHALLVSALLALAIVRLLGRRAAS